MKYSNTVSRKKKRAIVLKCQEMSGLDPEFEIRMTEIKVVEMNATIN